MHTPCQLIHLSTGANGGLHLADHAVRIDLGDAKAEPKWQLLFPEGIERHRSDFPGGRLVFDRAALAAMATNYAAEGKPRRAVNYFHRGASEVAAPIADKIAAGRIVDVALRDAEGDAPAGLYAKIKWTARAREFIANEEIDQLSPEFHPAAKSKRTGEPIGMQLLGAALLNDPYLTELPPAQLADKPNTEAPRMDLKELAKLLGLTENASEADVRSALEKHGQLALAEKAQATALSEAAAKVTALTEQVATLTAAQRKAEINAFLDARVAAGQVTAATRGDLEALGLAHGLDSIKFAEKLPKVVNLEERGANGNPSDELKRKALVDSFWADHAKLTNGGLSFSDATTRLKGSQPEAFTAVFGGK